MSDKNDAITMSVRQHTNYRSMLLGIVFLFFNCVCTAAPVIKITSEDYKQVVALQLPQPAGATETEEESPLTVTLYVSRMAHFSFRQQHPSHAYNTDSNRQIALADIGWQPPYLSATYFLPTPGYYAFLFRYNLF